MREAQGSLEWTRRASASSTGLAQTPAAIGRIHGYLHGQVMQGQGGSVCGTPAGRAPPLGLTTVRLASGGEPGIRCAGSEPDPQALRQRRGVTQLPL